MPRVKLYANLRNIAGTKELLVPGTSVLEVVAELVRQKPALERYLLEDARLRRHVLITLNGHPTQDEQAQVAEQDVMAIFPPIGGG